MRGFDCACWVALLCLLGTRLMGGIICFFWVLVAFGVFVVWLYRLPVLLWVCVVLGVFLGSGLFGVGLW